jgi:glycosyltransferase involved in cell wall biosynthesis
MYKIGIGIITCDRFSYLNNCLESLPDFEGPIVIVNDGKQNLETKIQKLKNHKKIHLIQHESNKGVGISKNDALTYLLSCDVDHLFLLEDDIIILDKTVFQKYIEASITSGILHFNYGPGSPFNRKQNPNTFYDLHNRHLCDQHSEPNPKKIIDYGNNIKISLFEHTVAMFSYFNRKVLESVGLHDEQFYNAWEHVDLTYRIIKAGYHPPFWWFADIFDSHKYLTEAPGAIDNSSIAGKKEQWEKNVYGGREKYKIKHGHYPNQPPYIAENQVISCLKQIYTQAHNNEPEKKISL